MTGRERSSLPALLMTPLILAVMMAQVPGAVATVAQGPASAVNNPREVVVRTLPEWEALWKSHAGPQPAPAVDFSTSLVAAVFLGTRPTAGFGVEISATRRENDALVVEYVERAPGADAIVAQMLTSPFHIVKLPRFDGPVRFRKTATGGKP